MKRTDGEEEGEISVRSRWEWQGGQTCEKSDSVSAVHV